MIIKIDKNDGRMVVGTVISDIKEDEYNGKAVYKFGLGIGKDENGNDLPIVNVVMWNRRIAIVKYDKVLACGKLKVTQKEDKTYYSLTADFVSVENSEPRQATPKEFKEIDNNDDLQF